jgi:alanyl-tRNA synthetase
MSTTVLASYIAHYREYGHIVLPRYPLLHPAFSTSFVISAGVIDMQKRLSGEQDGPPRCLLIQPCFRHMDIPHTGSGYHLSFFLMGGALYFDQSSRRSVLDPIIRYLSDKLGINRSSLWLTRFSGGSIDGYLVGPDEEVEDAWVSLGMPETHVARLGPDQIFWREGAGSGLQRSGISGPHAEIFFDRGPNPACSRKPCLPGCSCGRFLELGNAVFPQYKLTDQGLNPIPHILAEAAIGLDRVSMVIEAADTIFDISALAGVKAEIEAGPLASISDPQTLYMLLDHVRAFCCLVSEGAKPGRKGRGQILRTLIRRCWTAVQTSGLEPHKSIRDIAHILLRHPEATDSIDLTANWAQTVTILEKELQHRGIQAKKRISM